MDTLVDQALLIHFSSCLALVLRVISYEVSEVSLTVLPSPPLTQIPVVLENAPSVITSYDARQVPRQRDGRRQR